MVKILVNDGIHPDGQLLLEEANYQVDTNKVAQEQLASRIGDYDVLIVRSATKVTKEIIDAGKKLKILNLFIVIYIKFFLIFICYYSNISTWFSYWSNT